MYDAEMQSCIYKRDEARRHVEWKQFAFWDFCPSKKGKSRFPPRYLVNRLMSSPSLYAWPWAPLWDKGPPVARLVRPQMVACKQRNEKKKKSIMLPASLRLVSTGGNASHSSPVESIEGEFFFSRTRNAILCNKLAMIPPLPVYEAVALLRNPTAPSACRNEIFVRSL